jgi:hypothetical protein
VYVPDVLKVCERTYDATGVIPALAADAVPCTPDVVARTVNVYAVPLLRPVTTKGLDEPEAVNPPGLDVAV